MQGGASADTLYGNAGNGLLQGGADSDSLSGGTGSDTLLGDAGADTYLFGLSSGQDYINNYDSDAAGTNADTVALGAGIATSSVTLKREGDSLRISIKGTTNTLLVASYFYADATSS